VWTVSVDIDRVLLAVDTASLGLHLTRYGNFRNYFICGNYFTCGTLYVQFQNWIASRRENGCPQIYNNIVELKLGSRSVRLGAETRSKETDQGEGYPDLVLIVLHVYESGTKLIEGT
jgi:hypothetical protein